MEEQSAMTYTYPSRPVRLIEYRFLWGPTADLMIVYATDWVAAVEAFESRVGRPISSVYVRYMYEVRS